MSDFLIEDGFVGDYAVENEGGGPRFPWIQASVRTPVNMKAAIGMGLVRDSFAKLDESSAATLNKSLSWIETSYDDEGTPTEFGAVSEDVRWVILCRPKILGMVKATREIVPLAKGMKERGEVTIARLLLGCVVNGELIRDAEKNPQIFTLKLRSTKTALIGSEFDKDCGIGRNDGYNTIAKLNAALVEHGKAKAGSWLAHGVSVQFAAIADKFPSKDGESESIGVRFVFKEGAGARPLPKAIVKDIHALITSPDFKELAANPFAKQAKKEDEEYSFVVHAEGDVAPIAGDW
jgi:hypothetical protein